MASSDPTDPIDPSDAPSMNFFDPAAAADPQPVFREMRSRCPVGNPIPGGGVCISRYEDVMYALKHPEIFSSAMPAGMIGTQRPLIPLHLDPPVQVKYRKLLDPLFANRKMQLLEDDVRKLAAELVAKFADAGECDFTADFAVPYPCTVFLRLMGLPKEDLGLFLELKDAIIRPDSIDPDQATQVRDAAGARIYSYFDAIVSERRAEPQDDLLGQLLSFEVEGEKLSHEEILDICYLFLLAGLDTVTATLSCSVAYLAQHPDRQQAIVQDPSLIPGAIEELLRWETPVVQIIRLMKQDITMHGFELKAGDMVTLVLGSADTDEAQFDDADEVQFDRAPNKHLAFGGGVHRCLGSHLARMELRIALEELHKAIPAYAVKAGETLAYTPGIREVSRLPLVFGASS